MKVPRVKTRRSSFPLGTMRWLDVFRRQETRASETWFLSSMGGQNDRRLIRSIHKNFAEYIIEETGKNKTVGRTFSLHGTQEFRSSIGVANRLGENTLETDDKLV